MQDVISAGPDRPRRPPPRRLVVVVLIAAVVVAVLVVTHLGQPHDGAPDAQTHQPSPSAPQASRAAASTAASPFRCPTTSPGAASAAPDEAAALAIGDPASATALLRRDASAAQGPWSVVVRRDGGSFGSQSAVVTFPAEALAGPPVDVGGHTGTRGPRTIVWPVAGARARVRGDLPAKELVSIARATTIASRRPVVRPPAGYTVSVPRPYRPTEVHELRYTNDADLGRAGAELGFVYTGVLRGAAFEDQLFALNVPSTASVAGHPAFVSRLMGGSATLAWSPAPGVIAYVGYSGGPLNARTTAALGCLARASRLMSDAEWRATRPVVGRQPNDIG